MLTSISIMFPLLKLSLTGLLLPLLVHSKSQPGYGQSSADSAPPPIFIGPPANVCKLIKDWSVYERSGNGYLPNNHNYGDPGTPEIDDGAYGTTPPLDGPKAEKGKKKKKCKKIEGGKKECKEITDGDDESAVALRASNDLVDPSTDNSDFSGGRGGKNRIDFEFQLRNAIRRHLKTHPELNIIRPQVSDIDRADDYETGVAEGSLFHRVVEWLAPNHDVLNGKSQDGPSEVWLNVLSDKLCPESSEGEGAEGSEGGDSGSEESVQSQAGSRGHRNRKATPVKPKLSPKEKHERKVLKNPLFYALKYQNVHALQILLEEFHGECVFYKHCDRQLWGSVKPINDVDRDFGETKPEPVKTGNSTTGPGSDGSDSSTSTFPFEFAEALPDPITSPDKNSPPQSPIRYNLFMNYFYTALTFSVDDTHFIHGTSTLPDKTDNALSRKHLTLHNIFRRDIIETLEHVYARMHRFEIQSKALDSFLMQYTADKSGSQNVRVKPSISTIELEYRRDTTSQRLLRYHEKISRPERGTGTPTKRVSEGGKSGKSTHSSLTPVLSEMSFQQHYFLNNKQLDAWEEIGDEELEHKFEAQLRADSSFNEKASGSGSKAGKKSKKSSKKKKSSGSGFRTKEKKSTPLYDKEQEKHRVTVTESDFEYTKDLISNWVIPESHLLLPSFDNFEKKRGLRLLIAESCPHCVEENEPEIKDGEFGWYGVNSKEGTGGSTAVSSTGTGVNRPLILGKYKDTVELNTHFFLLSKLYFGLQSYSTLQELQMEGNGLNSTGILPIHSAAGGWRFMPHYARSEVIGDDDESDDESRNTKTENFETKTTAGESESNTLSPSYSSKTSDTDQSSPAHIFPVLSQYQKKLHHKFHSSKSDINGASSTSTGSFTTTKVSPGHLLSLRFVIDRHREIYARSLTRVQGAIRESESLGIVHADIESGPVANVLNTHEASKLSAKPLPSQAGSNHETDVIDPTTQNSLSSSYTLAGETTVSMLLGGPKSYLPVKSKTLVRTLRDVRGNSPLNLATHFGYSAIVKELINHNGVYSPRKSHHNARDSNLLRSDKDLHGWSPLITPIHSGPHLGEIFQTLIKVAVRGRIDVGPYEALTLTGKKQNREEHMDQKSDLKGKVADKEEEELRVELEKLLERGDEFIRETDAVYNPLWKSENSCKSNPDGNADGSGKQCLNVEDPASVVTSPVIPTSKYMGGDNGPPSPKLLKHLHRKLLEQHRDNWGCHPLLHACFAGNVQIVRLLAEVYRLETVGSYVVEDTSGEHEYSASGSSNGDLKHPMVDLGRCNLSKSPMTGGLSCYEGAKFYGREGVMELFNVEGGGSGGSGVDIVRYVGVSDSEATQLKFGEKQEL